MASLLIWNFTWQECVAMHEENRTPLVTWEGHLIASRDRKLEIKKGYEMYRSTLALAFKHGKEIPGKVVESEPELFGRLMEVEEPHPVELSTPTEEVDGQSSLFGEHLSWLDCR